MHQIEHNTKKNYLFSVLCVQLQALAIQYRGIPFRFQWIPFFFGGKKINVSISSKHLDLYAMNRIFVLTFFSHFSPPAEPNMFQQLFERAKKPRLQLFHGWQRKKRVQARENAVELTFLSREFFFVSPEQESCRAIVIKSIFFASMELCATMGYVLEHRIKFSVLFPLKTCKNCAHKSKFVLGFRAIDSLICAISNGARILFRFCFGSTPILFRHPTLRFLILTFHLFSTKSVQKTRNNVQILLKNNSYEACSIEIFTKKCPTKIDLQYTQKNSLLTHKRIKMACEW